MTSKHSTGQAKGSGRVYRLRFVHLKWSAYKATTDDLELFYFIYPYYYHFCTKYRIQVYDRICID